MEDRIKAFGCGVDIHSVDILDSQGDYLLVQVSELIPGDEYAPEDRSEDDSYLGDRLVSDNFWMHEDDYPRLQTMAYGHKEVFVVIRYVFSNNYWQQVAWFVGMEDECLDAQVQLRGHQIDWCHPDWRPSETVPEDYYAL